jgi:hypothetical protein
MTEFFVETLRSTLLRTGGIALAIGVGFGLLRRSPALIPMATLSALWITLGGHYVEILFRNYLGPRLRLSGGALAIVRLAFWFVGGLILFACAMTTRTLLTGLPALRWHWWMGGVIFIGVELIAHLFLQARGQPSFYNGRG